MAFHQYRFFYPILCLIILSAQMSFSWQTRDIRPDLGYVPTPPSSEFLQGMALGDDQFMFRSMALMLQNSGDTFGRFSSLKLYDMDKLTKWFTLLDRMDETSDMLPSMAAYYFSQTQNTKDVRYLVNYLYVHSVRNVEAKWWWLMQSIYLANHKLDDSKLALTVALPLRNPKLPVLAQQMLAIVYEKRGELAQAYDMILGIQKNVKNIPEKELRYMQYFVEERLGRMEDYENQLKDMGKELEPPIPTDPSAINPKNSAPSLTAPDGKPHV